MQQGANSVPADKTLLRIQSQTSIAIPGPIDDEGLALECPDIDKPPESTVVTLIAIIAHDEEAVLRNLNRSHVVTGTYIRGQDLGVDMLHIGFLQKLIIDEDFLVFYANHIARDADDSFDEVFGGIQWVTKYDDVATLWFSKMSNFFVPKGDLDAVDELVHQNMVANEQSGLHGTGRDLERLNNKTANEQSQENRNDDRFSVFS